MSAEVQKTPVIHVLLKSLDVHGTQGLSQSSTG